MYSIYREGKSVVAERFIRTLENNIYKHITSISKNVYIDQLDEILIKYNNRYHSKILLMLKKICILTLVKKVMIKILNLKFLQWVTL